MRGLVLAEDLAFGPQQQGHTAWADVEEDGLLARIQGPPFLRAAATLTPDRELAPRPQAHARREAVQAHREAVLQLPQRETRQVRCLLPRLVEDAHEFLPAAHRNDLQVAQPGTHVWVVGLRHFAPAEPSRGRHLLTWGKPFQGGPSWGLSVGMSCPDARLNWLGMASRARG